MEKNVDRTHRVGTVTCGLMFVAYGILFLLHTIIPKLDYAIFFDLWPLVLISLGVEILVSCTRKNREEQKIVYDFPAVLLVMLLVLFVIIMAAADYGMRVTHAWNSEHLFNYSSSYFSQYSAERHNGQSRVRGTVCLAENDAVLETVDVEKDTTITVSGYLGRVTGDTSLLYTTEDGADIFIADCSNTSFDKTISIPVGKGSLGFAGTGGEAVCDFDIQILWGDDVALKTDTMESARDIESGLPEESKVPEIDEISPVEEMEDPVIDNWPESIRCDSEGMYAGLYKIPVTIEEPMDLLLSCVTESGSINLWIEDAGGRKVFDEQDIWTSDYTIPIDKAGDYTVCFEAEYYYGSFVITPRN